MLLIRKKNYIPLHLPEYWRRTNIKMLEASLESNMLMHTHACSLYIYLSAERDGWYDGRNLREG